MKNYKDMIELLREAEAKGAAILAKFESYDEISSFATNCGHLRRDDGEIELTEKNVKAIEWQAQTIIKTYADLFGSVSFTDYKDRIRQEVKFAVWEQGKVWHVEKINKNSMVLRWDRGGCFTITKSKKAGFTVFTSEYADKFGNVEKFNEFTNEKASEEEAMMKAVTDTLYRAKEAYGEEMTEAQERTATRIKESFLDEMHGTAHAEKYEIKEEEEKVLKGGDVSLVIESGMKGDEGTLAAIYARNRVHVFIRPDGSLFYFTKNGRKPKAGTVGGLFGIYYSQSR